MQKYFLILLTLELCFYNYTFCTYKASQKYTNKITKKFLNIIHPNTAPTKIKFINKQKPSLIPNIFSKLQLFYFSTNLFTKEQHLSLIDLLTELIFDISFQSDKSEEEIEKRIKPIENLREIISVTYQIRLAETSLNNLNRKF